LNADIACPFVYADGKHCTGTIYRAIAYGRRPDGTVKKWRLHCSEKGDHAGAAHDFVGKERMEFYPDRLPVREQELQAAGIVEG
jgi:hypothetical protein